MDKQAKIYLWDILASIERIESFFEEKPMLYEEYHTDRKLRLAVERSIEIIGEAMNRLLKLYPDVPISNANAIVGTRNRIIHAYDAISDDIIWSIIVNHLGKLKEEVTYLISEDTD